MVETPAPALRHLACIMDGNRRWAQKQGAESLLYQEPAVHAMLAVMRACLSHRVPYLSLYAFSLENAEKRSAQVRTIVFEGVLRVCHEQRSFFIEQGICVRFLGVRALYPAALHAAVEELEQATQHGMRLTVCVLLCYGAQQEIVDAATRLAADVQAHRLPPGAITTECFSAYLWTGSVPSPDLIIRTGGVRRLSNFLLFQAAYAELLFLDLLWPELTREVVEEAFVWFKNQQRNFGS